MKKSDSRISLFIAVMVMDLLVGMEFDLFIPGFPELRHLFHLTPFWVESLLSVNFIGFCISLLMVGTLSDRYGRKSIILLGLIIFILGSVLCLWPASFEVMLMGRFFQGMGIAAPSILSFLVIADAYPLEKQQFYLAMLNGVMNTSVAIAPVLGSYITLFFHWQGNFVALLGLGIVTALMILILVPKHDRIKLQSEPVSESYGKIFQSLPLLLLMTHCILMCMPYRIFVGISPLLYLHDLRVSLHYFGFYQGILALIFAIGSVLFGLALKYDEQKKWLKVGMGLYMASFLAIGWLTWINSHSPFWITFGFIIFVISQIIPSVIVWPVILNWIPHAKGKVAAVMQMGQLIFTAFSLQIVGYFYVGSFREMGVMILVILVGVMVTYYYVLRAV